MRQGVRRVDTHAWPSSNRFLNEMVHQKRCQDPTLLHYLLESSDILKKAVEHGRWGFHSSVTSFVLPVFETYLRHSMFFFSNSKRLKQIAKAPLLMNPANRLQKSRGFLPEIKKEINEKKRPKFQWNSQMLLANWGTSNSTEHPSPYKLFEGHVSCWDKYRECKLIFNFCANCVADCSAPSDFYFASLEIWICFLGAAVVPCQHVCKKGALLILVEMKCKFCEESYLSEKKMYNCWGNITSHI